MNELLNQLQSLVPTGFDILAFLKVLGILIVVFLAVGFIGRLIFGKKSALNQSVSAAIGILFIYVVTVCVYTFQPHSLTQLISPLPFVTFFEDYVILSPVIGVS